MTNEEYKKITELEYKAKQSVETITVNFTKEA